ncbi:proteasome assembly chaperone family protein [Halorubrum sp. CBA1125]|uniref:proteasome assembly chaperone family protein n=1 Tax=Halorubrum sp. CBA1125 TaxID=2668072 RepID=UPI0012E9193E|nr:PAC2 family protein [Halorubrum sp. CBA1125]MUW13839.1 proteasome assembly chaperone family protein [Halorubrum sp. CBA1125]
MADPTSPEPTFSVTHDSEPSKTLIAGFSSFGLAGLTAVDYLVDNLGLEARGHVRTNGIPSITPFEKGIPRHPIRLYGGADVDVTVLVAEQFVPPVLGDRLAAAILDWTDAVAVSEIAVLAGVPVPHGPDAHQTFYVATDDYRAARLDDGSVPPMEAGFLDGTNASLLERGIDSPLGVGVFVTPVHAQAPDVEAAVRLVDTVESTYDLGVDSEPLASFAAEIRRHYEDLAERIDEREPDGTYDRMYM